jgi:hypothetical protein
MSHNNLFYLFFILLFAANAFGQQSSKMDITIHSRVDTSNQEVKTVAQLWINYLNAQPDSSYDNPYWNSAEKRRYKKVDLSADFLYQFPSQQLLIYYKPTILSIEKEDENYSIRTLFSADGLEGTYRKSNPWCITKLYAVKENQAWKLKNALSIITEKWNRTTIGKITFVYSPQHVFNKALATKANNFCNEQTKQFDFPEWKPYITNNGDELGKLLNFDYYFAGYTTGVSMYENRMLFSGRNSEFYPHELMHLIVPAFDRHAMIEEGFATWKGGAEKGESFTELAKVLANEVSQNDTVTFEAVLNKQWGYQFAAYYTTGAMLCNAAYKKGGVKMVKELLSITNDNTKLLNAICKIFEIKKEDVNAFWRKEVMKFKK